MKDVFKFIGRDVESNLLLKELGSGLGTTAVHPVINLYGEKGSGRRSLLQFVWESPLTRMPTTLRVRLDCSTLTEDANLATTLSETLESNDKKLTPVITLFRKEYAQSLRDYTDSASAAESQENNSIGADMQLDIWMETFFQHFVRHPDNTRGLQLLIELDDFDLLSENLKDLIIRLLIQPLSEQHLDPQARFIVTGKKPLKQSPDLLKCWSIFGNGPQDIELKPFTLSEVSQWVREHDHPEDISPRLLDESRGLPGNLDSAAEHIIETEHSQGWLAIAEKVLAPLPREQQRMLCQAALLPIITENNLSIFVNAEQARNIMRLLPSNTQLKFRDTGRGLRFPKELQRSLQKWYEKNFPAEYRIDNAKAAAFTELISILPETKDRETLNRLSIFNYFNNEVLTEIYGSALARQLIEYVESHSNLFEHTTGNHRISPNIRKALETFNKVSSFQADAEDLKRVANAWHKRREEILSGKSKTEERLQNQEKNIDALKNDIRKIQHDLLDRKERLENLKKRYNSMPLQSPRDTNKSMGSSVAMQLLGVALLYVGIFFSDTLPLAYAVVGILLIFAGLFLQSKHLRPQTSTTTQHKAPLNTENAEKNMQFLNLKKNQLQVKLGAFTSNVQRYKNELREFDALLREPYS